LAAINKGRSASAEGKYHREKKSDDSIARTENASLCFCAVQNAFKLEIQPKTIGYLPR
jgi:hypothetical protein